MHHVQVPGQKVVRHVTPGTLEEALAVLGELGPAARPVAGGTDLLLELARGARPGVEVLVDLTRVAGLDQVRAGDDGLQVGALVTHTQVIASPDAVRHALPLAQACLEVGAPPLRNRATVAGNLVTASPANDTISALLALDAGVTLASRAGARRVPVGELFEGFRRTVIAPGELLTEITVPNPPEGLSRRGIFAKLGLRRAQAISVVHVAVVVLQEGPEPGAPVVEARVAAGSVAPTVVRLAGAERALAGRALDTATIRAAAEAARAEVEPIDDIRGTAAYRRDTLEVLVRRALGALATGQERSRWPGRPVLLGGDRSPDRGPHRRAAHDASTPVECTVNGSPVSAAGAVGRTLLDWLRDEAGPALGTRLTGTKEGCAEGECGACTVHLDGAAVLSCLVPAARAHGTEVVTIEGLGGAEGGHPLQRAFVDQAAVQCGFCTPGFLMAGAKLLEERPSPTPDEIVAGLAGNLCRCTGYCSIVSAVEQAAGAGGRR